MRLPYAAQTLIDQVKDMRKTAKYEIDGDADGFDVARSIKFDKATSKWLEPILLEIAADDTRIVGVGMVKDQLTVVFSARSVLADDPVPFPLAEAEELVKARED